MNARLSIKEDLPDIKRTFFKNLDHRYCCALPEGMNLDEVFLKPFTMNNRSVVFLTFLDDNGEKAGFGFYYFLKRCKTANISIGLLPEKRNLGMGMKVLKSYCDFLFENLDIERLEAGIPEPNTPSRRLAEKFGFKHEGTQREAVYVSGKPYDYLLYGLLKKEYAGNA